MTSGATRETVVATSIMAADKGTRVVDSMGLAVVDLVIGAVVAVVTSGNVTSRLMTKVVLSLTSLYSTPPRTATTKV